MRFEYELVIILKMMDWAGCLSDDIDFIDYWYHLCLTSMKLEIEQRFVNRINAFYWRRWKTDFEQSYVPKNGKCYSEEMRRWYAFFLQNLVYALQVSSGDIVCFYGKDVFTSLMDMWFKYHTFGEDKAISAFAEKFGLPPEVNVVYKISILRQESV